MSRLIADPRVIQTHLAQLIDTPACLAAAVAGLDEARLRLPPAPRQWSAIEILAHLRSCADLWGYSIYAMLTEDKPTLPLLDPRRWARALRYTHLEFAPAFQVFNLQRRELLNVLNSIPSDAWNRTADIGGRAHSIFSQTRRLALHEVEHCVQFEALFTA